MQSTPWWGVPFLTGLFALAGVLIAQLFVLAIERRRRQRDDQQRWDRERQACYFRFLNAARAIAYELPDVGKTVNIDSSLIDALNDPYEEIWLIASDLVCERAEELRDELIGIANGETVPEEIHIGERRNNFIDAVRTELRVVPPRRRAAHRPL